MNRIPLCEPVFSGRERQYLIECVESGFVSSVGPFVTRFENAFAEKIGRRYAVACASGTAALHVALLCAGVGVNDEVPVSDFTFIASVNAIRYCGANPILVDSEISSWNLDTSALYADVMRTAKNGGSIPNVIEVVHILGNAADVEPLLALRDEFGIVLVEDAAEALGARAQDTLAVGQVGEISCFSFNGNKIITAGGGGMIACDDPRLAERARHLTTQARLPGPSYHHDEVGFNYRLTNIAAAVGLAQLEQLDTFLAAKKRIRERYLSNLAQSSKFSFALPHKGSVSSNWLSSVLCSDEAHRDTVLRRLEDARVDARPVWIPIHKQLPYIGCKRVGGENSIEIAQRGVSLPSSVNLSNDEIDRVCDVLLEE